MSELDDHRSIRRAAPLRSRLSRLAAAAALLTSGLIAATLSGARDASAATYVKGMDVSAYQPSPNWKGDYADGYRFAFIKATEGSSYTNKYFSAQYDGAYKAGFIRGAYHFANPAGASGKAQADYFIAHGGGWSADGRTMPPALDIEYGSPTCYGLSQSAMVSWIKSFNTEMHTKTKKYPMIYTTLDWWTQCTGNTSAFAKTNPFWIARPGSTQPTPPAGTSFWTIWQYGSSSSFGDYDRFNGSMTQLKALATNHD